MSALIKAGTAAGSVRPVAMAQWASPTPKVDEERLRLEKRIASLEFELRQRDVAIEALRIDVENARRDGEELGRKTGLAEAEDRQSARLAILEHAVRTANSELASKLSSLQRLAPLLARDCVEILIGNPDYRDEMLREALRLQLARIERGMLINVHVSGEDFVEAERLAVLDASLGLPTGTTIMDPGAPSGTCAIKLRLGSLEVGIDQQWCRLREELEQMSAPEIAP